MKIREAEERDLHGLLQLYMQLHDNAMPEFNEKLCHHGGTVSYSGFHNIKQEIHSNNKLE